MVADELERNKRRRRRVVESSFSDSERSVIGGNLKCSITVERCIDVTFDLLDTFLYLAQFLFSLLVIGVEIVWSRLWLFLRVPRVSYVV